MRHDQDPTGVPVGARQSRGYIDIEEDEPGTGLKEHDCSRCQPLPRTAREIDDAFGTLWVANLQDMGQGNAEMDTLRKLRNGLLGRVHILVALVLERATLDRPEEESRDSPG